MCLAHLERTSLTAFLGFLTNAVFLLIAVVTLIDFVVNRDSRRRDAALAFWAIAGQFVLNGAAAALGISSPLFATAGSLLAATQPFFFLQLVGHVWTVPRAMKIAALCGLLFTWAAVIAQRLFINPAEKDQPLWFILAAVGLVVYFVVVDGYAGIALVRAALRAQGPERRSLFMGAAGSVGLALAFIVALVILALRLEGEFVSGLIQVLVMAAGIAFYFGFAPPDWIRRSWQSLRLGGQVVGLVAVATLLTAGFTAGLVLLQMREQALELARREQTGLANFAAATAREHLEGARQAATLMSSTVGVRAAATTGNWSSESVQVATQNLANLVPTFGTAFVLDRAGILRVSSSVNSAAIGTDLSTRDYFQGALATRQAYVSEPYSLATGPTFAVAAPIFDPNGEIVGVIGSNFDLAQLDALIDNVGSAPQSRVSLLSPSGLVAVNTDSTRVLKPSTEDTTLGARPLAGESGVVTERGVLDGVERLVAFAPVRGIGWGVLVSTPTVEVFRPVDLATNRAILAAGGLILALALLGVLATRRLFAPLSTLATVVGELGGDLSRRVTPSGAVDVRALGERFNQMADNLASREASILELGRRNELILNSAGEGIVGIDLDGNITFMNPAAGEILGLETDIAVGKEFHALAHHTKLDGEPLLSSDCPHVLALGTAAPRTIAEDLFWNTSGFSFPVECTTQPVLDDGVVTGAVLTFRNITERKELDLMKEEMVSVVSHELRTPLASLVGFSELLLTRNLTEDQRRLYLDTMLREGRRLTSLINDFLDIQRIERGVERVTPVPLQLAPLIRRAVSSLTEDDERPVEVTLPPELPIVLADADRVLQIMGNLLSNARKYSPAGGAVEVSTRETNGVLEIAIKDHGLGMPADALPKLFHKFYRVDNSDRRQIRGTGLGLAIVRLLAEAMGGQAWAESPGSGLGSTFFFTLPLAPVQLEDGAAESQDADEGAGKLMGADLLVVEDDAVYAALQTDTLTAAGYSVRTVSSVEAALAAMAFRKPSAVLLDIRLGDRMYGWDLLAAIRENPETREMPVLVVSSYEQRDRAEALQVDEYLLKPVSRQELLRTLDRLHIKPQQRVLVVEDDESERLLALTVLGQAGFEPVGVPNGTDALVTIRESPNRFQLVVLDLGLPDIDGFSVLSTLRSQAATRDLPVVIYTARDLTPEDRRTLADAAADVVRKGNGLAIEEAVKRALAQQEAS